jgi:Mg-chelatase subunit ChlD
MKRRETNVFSIAFLDLLSGALGAVIILYVAVPKSKTEDPKMTEIKAKEGYARVLKAESQADMKSDRDAKFNELEELKENVSNLSKIIKDLTKKNESLSQEKSQAQQKVANLTKQIEKEKDEARDRKTASIPVDVGFKFKGKRIVFVIDVSGSMFMEDKIGQVKAGLKMLITSMDSEFHIDVVSFPDGRAKNYRRLWSKLRPLHPENKKGVYRYLHNLRPYGATPTRDVMKYVLKRYSDATDIVLLSDGAPTRGNSNKLDDIFTVSQMIRNKNYNQAQISTVGVGSDFLTDTNNPKYIFLKRVAEQNKGFFVGF